MAGSWVSSSSFTLHLPTVHPNVATLGYPSEMTEHAAVDRRVDAVTRRLQDDLVDGRGLPAEPGEVERVVDEAAKSFADAPVQEFVPLLIEHQARDELRGHGLRRDLGEERVSSETNDGSAETDERDRETATRDEAEADQQPR